MLRSKIYTRSREWPNLASPPLLGTGVPLTIFFKGGVKNQHKMYRISCKNFGATKKKKLHETLPQDVLLDGVDNVGTTFGGHCPLKIWEGKKRLKISAIYVNFRVWPQISLERVKISTSGKKRYQVQLILHWIKKIGELWSTNTRDYAANIKLPTLSQQCMFCVY